MPADNALLDPGPYTREHHRWGSPDHAELGYEYERARWLRSPAEFPFAGQQPAVFQRTDAYKRFVEGRGRFRRVLAERRHVLRAAGQPGLVRLAAAVDRALVRREPPRQDRDGVFGVMDMLVACMPPGVAPAKVLQDIVLGDLPVGGAVLAPEGRQTGFGWAGLCATNGQPLT